MYGKRCHEIMHVNKVIQNKSVMTDVISTWHWVKRAFSDIPDVQTLSVNILHLAVLLSVPAKFSWLNISIIQGIRIATVKTKWFTWNTMSWYLSKLLTKSRDKMHCSIHRYQIIVKNFCQFYYNVKVFWIIKKRINLVVKAKVLLILLQLNSQASLYHQISCRAITINSAEADSQNLFNCKVLTRAGSR